MWLIKYNYWTEKTAKRANHIQGQCLENAGLDIDIVSIYSE